MLPKKGNVFPGRNRGGKSRTDYATAIAVALRGELGDTHRAIKTVMRWTGASDRTVKHWFGGEKGPSGGYLLLLINKSDAVLHALLVAAGRDDVLAVDGVSALAGSIDGALERTRAIGARRRKESASAFGHEGRRPSHNGDDPENVPDDDPINDPETAANVVGLNDRQRWILRRLIHRQRISLAEVRRRFGVSEKTVKRDIAALKGRGLIRFVGSPRTGTYEIVPR